MAKRKTNRLGEERLNYQGCLMKIVEYNDSLNVVVEFQDKYHERVCRAYHHFLSGNIKNPYYPSVYGVGAIGVKYYSKKDGKHTKEYSAWKRILERCYDKKLKNKNPAYKDVSCCEEWLLFENFYDWLHSQENFYKWYNGKRWAIDKDILVKGNKIYSPETCCLVPIGVNSLFTKRELKRGDLPIGVLEQNGRFRIECNTPFEKYNKYLGMSDDPINGFYMYKNHKEEIIKQVAQKEYELGNISKRCYKAMLEYKVEITD